MNQVRTKLSVEPLAPFGAIVRGVEVTGDLGPSDIASLKSYVYQYGLIVLRGQDSPGTEQFEAFMRELGPIADPAVQGRRRASSMAAVATAGRTNDVVLLANRIVEDGKPLGYPVATKGLGWHTDYSWADTVSAFAALEAQVVPSSGGETAFANMHAAYDALEPDLRRRLDRLTMMHCMPVNREFREDGEEDLTLSNVRPLVVTNPDNGRRALYLSPLYTTRILGVPDGEAADLRAHLVDFATSPRFTLDHSWLPGDIVLWDEIGLVHCRRPFDEAEPRLMRQIVVLVDDPAAPFAHTG